MKRILCTLLLLCLLCLFPFPAAADTEGVQRVSLEIPCTVTLDVGRHGKAMANGRVYTGQAVGRFQVWAGTKVDFDISPDGGYEVSSLSLDGTDVKSGLKEGVYSVVINHDETVAVRFDKKKVPPFTPTPETPSISPSQSPGRKTRPPGQGSRPNQETAPKTGDENPVGLWVFFLILSAAILSAAITHY